MGLFMWSGQTSWGQYFGVGEIEMVIVPKLFISWLHMTTHNVCPGTLFTMPHAAAPAMTYVRHRPTRCVFSFRSKVFSDRHYVACAISSLVYSMIIMIDGRRLKCVIEAPSVDSTNTFQPPCCYKQRISLSLH